MTQTRISSRLSHWCEQQIVHFPWLIIFFALLLCAGSGYYTYGHLSVNTNTAEMLSPDLPFQQNQRKIDTAFPQDAYTTLFVIDGNSPEEAAQSASNALNLIQSKTDHFSSAYIPTDNAFFRQQALLYLDTPDLETVAKQLTDAQPFIGFLAQNYSLGGLFDVISQALNEKQNTLPMDLNPLLQAVDNTISAKLDGKSQSLSWQNLLANNKLSEEATRVLIIAKPIVHFDEMLPVELAQNAAHEIADTIMAENPNVRVRITGETALEHEELETVSNGATLSGVMSLVLVFLAQWIGVRSFRLVVITYIVLMMGLILTAGFAALSVGHLNVISIAFATLYIGLGVDYAVHICLYYRERKARGYSNLEAIHHSLKGVGGSLFLCALTTALGFLAFIPTDYAGVSELGIISGGGIFIGLLISLTVLPALFCILPVNHPQPIHSKFAPQFIVTFPFHFSKAIRIVSILLAIGACGVLTKLTFDANPINLRDPKSESVSTIKDLLKSKNDSPFAVTGLAKNLDDANALAAKMKTLSSVYEAITLSSFVAENQDEKLAILEDLNLMLGNQLENFNATLPQNHDQRDALVKLNEQLKKAISDNTKNAPIETLTKLQSHVEMFLNNHTGEPEIYSQLEKNVLGLLPYTLERLRTSLSASAFELNDISDDIRSHWVSEDGFYKVLITPAKDQNIEANMKEFVAQIQSVDNSVSGLPIANEMGGGAVVKAFVQAFGSAFLAITLLLWAIYRSFKHTAIVIAPLMLAALLTGATNVLLDNPFNFANVIALPLLLGMGIDSSILIMHRLHFNVSENENLLHSSTTRGIIFSSITTLCSFSSLAMTAHQGMASMGLLLSIGLFFTVICSLIVLPAWSGKRV
ncbi:MAG: MMPL family transporter [Methylococcales bacterium]|nr:MMPL family transporter [Methylococcales bacterium]